MDTFNNYHWWIFRLCGIRLDDRPEKPILVYTLQFLLFATIIYTIFGDIVLVIIFPINFQVFCGTAFPAANFLNAVLRQYYYMRNNKLFKEIAEDMVQLLKENDNFIKSGAVQDARKKLKMIQKMMIFRLICEYTIPTILYADKFIRSITDHPVALPLKGWNPFDVNVQPANIIMIFFQLFSIQCMTTFSSSQECVLFDFMFLQSVQAEHLAKDLTRIFKDNRENKEKLIGQWIQQHQKYIRIKEKLKTIFSPILFFYYSDVFASMIIACLMVTDHRIPFNDKLAFLQAGCLFLTVFFVLCRISDHHYETEKHILNTVLSLELVYSGRKIGKAMVFVKTQCNKITRFSSYGLYPLSSESFGVLTKASFSFIVTLLQIKLSKDGPP